MGEDAQHLKKAAALAYDYESDPRWSEYWSNVLVPDNRPKSEVERYFKFKFYQRNIDSDLKVEPLSSKSASTSSSSARSPSSQTVRPEERSNATQGASYSAARGNGGVNAIRMDQHSIGFLSNSLVIIMGVFAILPFMPLAISAKSYRLTFLATVVASGHSIYMQYGRPRAFNLQAIQIWLQSAVAGKDFIYFLYSIVFISTLAPIKFAMIPVICQALLNDTQFLKRNFSNTNIYRKYLEKPCRWLELNTATVRTLSANCEIGLGFLLVFLLLAPQKNFIQLLVYWQLLKLMYHAPTTASFHRTIWSRIGVKVNPLIHRYASFLESPLQFAKRWFHN
eukprot:c33174_g1_i1 orf=66-1076(+)